MRLAEALQDFERTFIEGALLRVGTVTGAAQELGLNRTHLHRRMKILNITSPNPHKIGRFNDG